MSGIEARAQSGDAGRRFALIVNPAAGGGRARRRLPKVEQALRSRSAGYEIVMTRSLEHGCAEAVRAAAAGAIPVVVSGDGLIGKIGGVLGGSGDGEGSRAPLGIIPGGRGNDLARVLGIPTDPAEAVAVLLDGEPRTIDVGEVNGKPFLGIASCGFDSDANRIANEARLVKGPLVYAYAALRALLQWQPARFTLTEDGHERSFTGYSVAVANSRAYGGGMFIAPAAELDDGLLDVITTAHVSKLRFLRGLPEIFKGTHVERPEVGSTRAAVVEIDADRPFAVYADGERVAELPVRIELRASALSVIVPTARA